MQSSSVYKNSIPRNQRNLRGLLEILASRFTAAIGERVLLEIHCFGEFLVLIRLTRSIAATTALAMPAAKPIHPSAQTICSARGSGLGIGMGMGGSCDVWSGKRM